ncbi:hypothetical protein IAR50_002765 [Cryptococcus sp. DSM 104548]
MGASFSSSMKSGYIYPTIQTFDPPLRVYRIEGCELPRLIRQLYAEERPCNVMVQVKPSVSVSKITPEPLVCFTLPPEERQVLSSRHYPESIISYPSIYSPSSPTPSSPIPAKKTLLYSPKPVIADPFRRSDPVRFDSLNGHHFSGIARVKYSCFQSAMGGDDIESIAQVMREASFGPESPAPARTSTPSLPAVGRTSIYSESHVVCTTSPHGTTTGGSLVHSSTPDTGIVQGSDLHRFSTAQYPHHAGRTSIMSLPPLCNSSTASLPESTIVKTPTAPAFHRLRPDRVRPKERGRSRAMSGQIMSAASRPVLRRVSSVAGYSSGPAFSLIDRSADRLSNPSLAAEVVPVAKIETPAGVPSQETVVPTSSQPVPKPATSGTMSKASGAPASKPIRTIQPRPAYTPDVFAGPSPGSIQTQSRLTGPRSLKVQVSQARSAPDTQNSAPYFHRAVHRASTAPVYPARKQKSAGARTPLTLRTMTINGQRTRPKVDEKVAWISDDKTYRDQPLGDQFPMI